MFSFLKRKDKPSSDETQPNDSTSLPENPDTSIKAPNPVETRDEMPALPSDKAEDADETPRNPACSPG